LHSGIIVIWNAVGSCLGVYRSLIRYTTEGSQFGKPLASFQMIQQKIFNIMANLHAILLSAWHLSQIYD
jgi:glutaryl-CoA dehydrogenase